MPADQQLLGDPPEGLVRVLRRAAWALVALGVVAFLIVGAKRPANPYLLAPDGRLSAQGLPGFATARLAVTPGYGLHAPSGACVLVASTSAQQSVGLMGQTSLHGFAGMAFRFSHPAETNFYMKDTLIPLTVAWFGADGGYLVSVDMKPCPTTQSICPTYGPGVPYQLALEVPQGKLGSLGIGPGSVLHLGGSCSA
ncbi:MAG TPA: DUF192 domain-containing protein [Acidimicrobiales bacterium]|nr:DUF192 domain-containing protein [Acidimicrobiales bacterium]